ncbi:unnamed protein product [Notodromas monacha]|uniref:Transmembrane protein 8B n=1 Tax=Notodromas monacha TaxID=399045 RepID=A0A7R9BTE0_9CRUS|nr:unnamed protein product [Notodromas monacha]CAG0920346.1 unnamed protein product [Notodromas monacha]
MFHTLVTSPLGIYALQPEEAAGSLRHGSFPIISPTDAKLPDNLFIPPASFYNTSLMSDNVTVVLNVSNPMSLDWFLAAFLPQKDAGISPGGMISLCQVTFFVSVMYLTQPDVIFVVPEIHDFQNFKLHQDVRSSQYYKFYVPADTWRVNVTLAKCTPKKATRGALCPVMLSASAESLPITDKPETAWKNCSEDFRSSTCTFEFMPKEEAWHFLRVEALTSSAEVILQLWVLTACSYQAPQQSYMMMTELTPRQICASLLKNVSQHASFFPNIYYLVQRSQPDYFSRAGCLERLALRFCVCCFECFTDSSSSRTYLERITGDGPMSYYFKLPNDDFDAPPIDSVEIPVSSNPHLFSFDLHSVIDVGGTLSVGFSLEGRGYGRPLRIPETNPGIRVFGCLAHGRRAELKADGWCTSGLFLQVNSSFVTATKVEVQVPFPSPGRWYLMLMAQCYSYNDGRFGKPELSPCRDEAALVKINAHLQPCLKGRCENSGCCRCDDRGERWCVGYRGWFCNDDAEALPEYVQLLATLLLTLSNLMFVPSIGIAIMKKFYSEALVFFVTMSVSALYHACDRFGAYSFCLLEMGVLQTLDFYCGLLSFWVTLLAMAGLPWGFKSAFHLLGAVGILLAVEMDRASVWAFVVPTAFAALIMFSAWVVFCSLDRRCYPGKRYFTLRLLPGLILGACGLAVFSFFETESNYYLTHSAWHALMAAALCFLLPFVHPGKSVTRRDVYGFRETTSSRPIIQTTTTADSVMGGATLNRKRVSVNHGHLDNQEERGLDVEQVSNSDVFKFSFAETYRRGGSGGMDTWLAQSPTENKAVVSVSPHPSVGVEGQSIMQHKDGHASLREEEEEET